MAKIALLIGISKYENNGLNSLPGATKDVEAMQRILQHPEIGGFEQVKVSLNSDPLEIQTEIQDAFSSNRRKDDGSVDIRNQLGSEGRAVLTSSTSTQYSFEQKETDLSIYTHYLIEGMETGGADRDKDGMVSVDELHEYAKNKVQEALPAMKPEIYAVKEGYKIFLTKALGINAQLQYRQEVERCLAERGKISRVSFFLLEEYRQQLGLCPEEAADIEEEVMKTFRESQQKLQRYEQALAESIEQKSTLGDMTQIELSQLRQVLALNKEDVASIEARLIKSPPVLPTADESRLIKSPPVPAKAETSANLSPAFLKLCQQELNRYIGPVAQFILEDTLEQYPHIGQRELLELLAAEITNPQKAREFTHNLELQNFSS